MQLETKLPQKGKFISICKNIYNKYCVILNDKRKITLTEDNYKKIPKTKGVYVIYQKKPRMPIYVGVTSGKDKGLYGRIIHNHLSRGNSNVSSSFRKKLCNLKKLKPKEVRAWVLNNCEFSWVKIDDYDERLLLETFLIKRWRKKGTLLNDNKGTR